MSVELIFILLLLAGVLIVVIGERIERRLVEGSRSKRLHTMRVQPVGPAVVERVFAPWTLDQVTSLNAYQEHGYVHPFTGPNGDILVATQSGWVEPHAAWRSGQAVASDAPIVQTWAHRFMTDWSWRTFKGFHEIIAPRRVWCEKCDDTGFMSVGSGPHVEPCTCEAGSRVR